MKLYYQKKEQIDIELYKYINTITTDMTMLNILSDTIQNGKRIRPILMSEMIECINKQPITDFRLPICVELIHNASLILDDMPMMDNDKYRRGQPTLHHKYDEKIALFTADLLLNQAGEIMFKYINEYIPDITQTNKLFDLYYENIGLKGIIGGQLLDLAPLNDFGIHVEDQFKSSEFLQQLNYQKTTTLFIISILLPFIIHQPNTTKETINDITNMTTSFGLIFQIADDIEDLIQDRKRQNEAGITCNFCLQIGNQNAIQLFNKHMKNVTQLAKKHQIYTKVFEEITQYLEKKVK